jgi:hypothetical protein
VYGARIFGLDARAGRAIDVRENLELAERREYARPRSDTRVASMPYRRSVLASEVERARERRAGKCRLKQQSGLANGSSNGLL